MKKKWMNDKYTHIALYAFLVVLAASLFLFLVLNLKKIFSFLGFLLFSARSVVFGVLLALILYPLCRKLEELFDRRIFRGKRQRATRILGVSLTFVVLLVALAVIAVSVLPMINQNYQELLQTIEDYISGAVTSIEGNPLIYNFFRALTGVTGGDANEIIEELIDRYSDLFSDLAGSLVTLLFDVIYSMADILIAIILAFYFLLARGYIRGLVRKMAVAFLPRRPLLQSTRFFRAAYMNLIEFFSSRFLCSFILGAMCYLFAFLFRIPFYPLISLIAMVLNIFPVLGPVAATLLCTLIVFLVKPTMTFPFFLLLIVLNVLEQYLVEKYLLNKHLRLNVALALVLVVVAYLIFGLWAVVFVIPVFVTLRTEAQIFLARRLRKKGYSTDTGDYISPEGAEIYTDPPAAPEETPPEENGAEGEDAEKTE